LGADCTSIRVAVNLAYGALVTLVMAALLAR